MTDMTPDMMQAVARYEAGRFSDAYAAFETMANDGCATARFWIAVMEVNGDGRPVDKAAGYEHCRAAAEMGNVQAQTNLGVMLIQGEGVAADPVAGLAWLCRAADSGDTGAQFNAAALLSAGKVVDKDQNRAAVYYRMAAEAGYFPAQARLGFCYRNGFGVEKDRQQAYLWLTLAAQHGAGTAIGMLEGLVDEMSPDELHLSRALVDRWMAQHGGTGAPPPQFQVDTQ